MKNNLINPVDTDYFPFVALPEELQVQIMGFAIRNGANLTDLALVSKSLKDITATAAARVLGEITTAVPHGALRLKEIVQLTPQDESSNSDAACITLLNRVRHTAASRCLELGRFSDSKSYLQKLSSCCKQLCYDYINPILRYPLYIAYDPLELQFYSQELPQVDVSAQTMRSLLNNPDQAQLLVQPSYIIQLQEDLQKQLNDENLKHIWQFHLRAALIDLPNAQNLLIPGAKVSSGSIRNFLNDLAHAPFLNQLAFLNLSCLGLTILPIEIARFTNLQSLLLTFNRLKELPAAIGQLTNLRRLLLDGNQLRSVPAEIGLLTRLRELDLDNNELQMLPESIGQLTKLKRLSLFNNRLTELPAEMGQLINLNKLSLYNNELKEFPAEMAQLINLHEVSFDNHLIWPKASLNYFPRQFSKGRIAYISFP